MADDTGNLNLKENVSRRSIWIRLVYMIVLAIAYGVAEAVGFAVVVFQFLASLFTGNPNDRLARFGRNLARYFQQITLFMTFATEDKPFPFGSWPDEPHEAPKAVEGPPTEDGGAAEDAAAEAEPEKPPKDASATAGFDSKADDNDTGGAEEAGEKEENAPKKRTTRRPAAKPKPRKNPKGDT